MTNQRRTRREGAGAGNMLADLWPQRSQWTAIISSDTIIYFGWKLTPHGRMSTAWLSIKKEIYKAKLKTCRKREEEESSEIYCQPCPKTTSGVVICYTNSQSRLHLSTTTYTPFPSPHSSSSQIDVFDFFEITLNDRAQCCRRTWKVFWCPLGQDDL